MTRHGHVSWLCKTGSYPIMHLVRTGNDDFLFLYCRCEIYAAYYRWPNIGSQQLDFKVSSKYWTIFGCAVYGTDQSYCWNSDEFTFAVYPSDNRVVRLWLTECSMNSECLEVWFPCVSFLYLDRVSCFFRSRAEVTGTHLIEFCTNREVRLV